MDSVVAILEVVNEQRTEHKYGAGDARDLFIVMVSATKEPFDDKVIQMGRVRFAENCAALPELGPLP